MTEAQYIAAMKSANAALERQDKQIVELKSERDEFHDSLVTVELLVSDYRIANAELEKERDELHDILKMASLLCKPESLEAHNLEQHRRGFWNGFENARCHPDEMNILQQWGSSLIFIESQKDNN